jgi:hypothetical protein
MISLAPGVATSQCEVTNISRLGFWVLVDEQIYGIEHVAPDQLYWPALDVDIDLRSLEYPEAFPLVFD